MRQHRQPSRFITRIVGSAISIPRGVWSLMSEGRFVAGSLFASLFLIHGVAFGQWPGLLGPNRNGHVASGEQLAIDDSTKLKVLWSLPAGQGYAGAAIDGEDVAVFERVGDKDVVRILDRANGKERWNRELPANYRGGIDADKGPRCVPGLLPKHVLVYSAAGDLALLKRADGQVQWLRNLRAEMRAEDGYFGAGSTPLVIDDRIIVNVGGKSGGVACLNVDDGKTLWSSTEAEASYASPILHRLGQKDVVVVPTRLKTFVLDPANGDRMAEFPFGMRGPTVNAATPIVTKRGDLFLTASYGIGSLLVRSNANGLEIVSKGTDISSQYASPVCVGNFIFGSDGREDMGSGGYKCIDAVTGELRWEKEDMPICHTIAFGDTEQSLLLLIGIDGQLWVVPASGSSFSPVWSSALDKSTYRALPAYGNGVLIVRSSSGASSRWLAVSLR